MMAYLLPASLVGLLVLLAFMLIITFWFLMMLPGVLLRCLRVPRLQRLASRYCVWIARLWVGTNRRMLRFMQPVRWDVELEGELDPQKSYLLLSNHQSWADILVIFDVFHRQTPFARFFLKRDLLFVPIVGVVCWAMDFPFMTRSAGHRDLETTRRACAIYREVPVTVVNFLEGTRFSEAKKQASRSPHARLLRPKSGGFAYTLNAMGEQFAGILDVTLIYENVPGSLGWNWLCGRHVRMRVHARLLPVPVHLLAGDYLADAAHREAVQQWLNVVWQEKDARLQQGLRGAGDTLTYQDGVS